MRVVRFYVSLLLLHLSSSSSSCFFSSFVVALSALKRQPPCPVSAGNCEPPRPVFPAGPQTRVTSIATLCGQCSLPVLSAHCSLPDLNRDPLRPAFPAGPQPRPSAASVPCRTSVPRSVPCRTSTATLCG